MKCSLEGLALRAACCIETGDQKAYYAHSLRELAKHIEDVREGRATCQEFLDHYCIEPKEKTV